MKKTVLTLCLVLAVFAPSLAAQDISKDLMTLMATLPEAGPPLILKNYVLFSYYTDELVYLVGAAFEHESYRQIHSFSKNQFNVFVLLLPYPDDIDNITYRFVVDGLWIHDPENSAGKKDRSGLRYSTISIPGKKQKLTKSPFVKNGSISFTYNGTPGKSVYLSGDFNNWNPYLYPMKEVSPGIYSLSLNLPPGTYFYCFYENGVKKLDSLNSNFALNRDNQEANFFTISRQF